MSDDPEECIEITESQVRRLLKLLVSSMDSIARLRIDHTLHGEGTVILDNLREVSRIVSREKSHSAKITDAISEIEDAERRLSEALSILKDLK